MLGEDDMTIFIEIIIVFIRVFNFVGKVRHYPGRKVAVVVVVVEFLFDDYNLKVTF